MRYHDQATTKAKAKYAVVLRCGRTCAVKSSSSNDDDDVTAVASDAGTIAESSFMVVVGTLFQVYAVGLLESVCLKIFVVA